MAIKTTPTQQRVGRVGQRRQVPISKEMLETPNLRKANLVADDALTPAEAVKVRHSDKQAEDGKMRPWAAIKNELGL